MNIFLFFLEIIVLCSVILFFSYFLGDRSGYSKNKNIPFESGIDSAENARIKFSTKFYLIPVFFAIFDIESIYIYIWSLVIRETRWIGLLGSAILIYFMIIQLIFLVKRNFLYKN